jgi:hypothetical protein
MKELGSQNSKRQETYFDTNLSRICKLIQYSCRSGMARIRVKPALLAPYLPSLAVAETERCRR